jgi:glycosyltransferase involved in cell wall biosynthesis
MLSILIPEHDYDCGKLVAELADQCLREGIPYEILVMDDASTYYLEKNRTIAEMPGCQFLESKVNLQSARIRNRLGQLASYPNLLFVDSDLEIRDNLFVRRYLDAMGKAPVIVGSIVYQLERPPVSQRLRWKYGRNRECLSLEKRLENPWKSFSSQNFIMEKGVFEQVPFDETFVKYGHEDTLFGLMLKKKGIAVQYIDNPLIHNGLETSESFLAKSLVAVEKYANLPVMRSAEVVENIRIYRFYERLAAWKLDGLVAFKYRLLEKCMRQHLCGSYPNLLIFDFYRLGFLCNEVRKRKRSGLEV